MFKEWVRQRYFVAKEIQLSIALIVVWSFVAVALFLYAVRAAGLFSGGLGIFAFIVILLGYALVVIVLSIFFSHRLIGPFDRLNSEINRIVTGEVQGGLKVRTRDDPHLRTFLEHVNKIIEELDNTRRWSDYCLLQVRSRLEGLLARLQNGEVPSGECVEQLAALNKTINSIIEEHRYKKR